MHINIYLKNKV